VFSATPNKQRHSKLDLESSRAAQQIGRNDKASFLSTLSVISAQAEIHALQDAAALTPP